MAVRFGIPSISLGSPIISPRLNGQIRGGMRRLSRRQWLTFGVVLIFCFIFLKQTTGSRQHPLDLGDGTHSSSSSSSSSSSGSRSSHHKTDPLQGAIYNHHDYSIPTFTRQSDVAVRKDFPPKIWQLWKVDPLHFEERDINTARSWPDRNPTWRYEVLTDLNSERYVEYHFGPEGFDRPDIVAFFHDVNAAIVKADLLRYLVMYAEGGVYADIDVEAMKPMSKFIPERYDHADINMVVGVEIDEPEWADHPILGQKSRSFCQWTFMCKPRLPVMLRLVENIMDWMVGIARNQSVPLGDVVLDFDDIIVGTGPSAFTAAIIDQLNYDRAARAEDGVTPQNISWDTFHDLDESKLVDHVLVLNVEAFAAGQGHSDSGTHDTRHSLVRHHYHASNWPSKHPRFMHPAYGQLEDCNWNADCIRKWDEDVARFDTLPPDEQQALVADRERRLAEEEAAEEARLQEEADARAKEEDEARRADAEKLRLEDTARLVEADIRLREGLTGPVQASRGGAAHAWFGYLVFVAFIAWCLYQNYARKRAALVLPMTEK